MTRFINPAHPIHHHGADRLEAVMQAAQDTGKSLSGVGGLSTALLSAVVAAVLVTVSQVMDNFAADHMIVMWMALWFVGFLTLAFFSGASRQLAANTKKSLDAWSLALAEASADKRLWAAAKDDHRVMADLQSATGRQEPNASASIDPYDNGTQGPAPVKLTAFMASPHTRYYI